MPYPLRHAAEPGKRDIGYHTILVQIAYPLWIRYFALSASAYFGLKLLNKGYLLMLFEMTRFQRFLKPIR